MPGPRASPEASSAHARLAARDRRCTGDSSCRSSSTLPGRSSRATEALKKKGSHGFFKDLGEGEGVPHPPPRGWGVRGTHFGGVNCASPKWLVLRADNRGNPASGGIRAHLGDGGPAHPTTHPPVQPFPQFPCGKAHSMKNTPEIRPKNGHILFGNKRLVGHFWHPWTIAHPPKTAETVDFNLYIFSTSFPRTSFPSRTEFCPIRAGRRVQDGRLRGGCCPRRSRHWGPRLEMAPAPRLSRVASPRETGWGFLTQHHRLPSGKLSPDRSVASVQEGRTTGGWAGGMRYFRLGVGSATALPFAPKSLGADFQLKIARVGGHQDLNPPPERCLIMCRHPPISQDSPQGY